MTSKQRFQTVYKHQLPDRFPMDYLASPATDKKLCDYYGLKNQDEILEKLEIDFYYLSFRDISQNESCLPFYRGPELKFTETERICPFGIRFIRGAYNSKFAVDEVIAGPLENATCPADILNHPWPKVKEFNLELLHKECEEHADKVLIGGCWTGILGDCFRMIGFEKFLMGLAMNPELIRTLINRMTDFYLQLNDRIFKEIGNKMDIWFWGNDYGSQNGLMFSKNMFTDFFLENTKRLNELAHSYDLKIMTHSCGSIHSIIPLLIEAGVDILDPIQVTAEGMDPATLKEKFGDQIVFHGAVDTQQVLPTETPDNVYLHAQETLRILGKEGGYIFAPSQLIQDDIPVENIEAMYRAAREFCPE